MNNKSICKVCGKEYEPCRTVRNGDETFNWKAVACSPECGEEYFRRIIASRTKAAPESEERPSAKRKRSVKPVINEVKERPSEDE